MKIKRILSYLLVFVMLFSLLPVGGAGDYDGKAAETAEEERLPALPAGYSYSGRSYTDELGSTRYYVLGPSSVYGVAEGYWIDENGQFTEDAEEGSDARPRLKATRLPSSYDARDDGLVTAVESQIGGTCWAHGSIAALESNAIKKGYADNTLDLNEYHLVWNAMNAYDPESDDPRNDGLISSNPADILDKGGNTSMAEGTLQNFNGAVTEFTLPLTSTSKVKLAEELSGLMTTEKRFLRDVTVERRISIGSDRNAIKNAILEYGGLYLAYSVNDAGYSHVSQSGERVSTYFNAQGETNGKHGVELIGWDDNFAVENFSQEILPKNKGAWLLKNSYGKSWGSLGGFFWMSYEEPTIYGITAITAADPDAFEEVYLYDGDGYGCSVTATKAANVFVCEKDCTLSAFSAGAAMKGSYTLKVYKLSDGYKNPIDGELLYTQKGDLGGQRYLAVTGSVPLYAGDRFSVVIEGLSSCYAEGKGSSTRKFTSHEGESYYYNGSWIDASLAGNNNVCVRAVVKSTENKDGFRVNFVCPGYKKLTAYSHDGVVALPQTEGHTWVLSYNGAAFDGSGVDKDMNVEAHCYPNTGSVADGSCLREYRCIFCGREQKESVWEHELVSGAVSPSETGLGYAYTRCVKCGEESRRDYTAYTEASSGTLNDAIHWQLYDGVLAVDGIGAIPDMMANAQNEWFAMKQSVQKIYINDGITKLGKNAFNGFEAIEVHVADSVKTLGSYAFANMTKLAAFNFPEGIETVSSYAFSGCTALENGYIPNAKSLSASIYYNCSGMKTLTVAEGVTALSGAYFKMSDPSKSALSELILPGTVKTLSGSFIDAVSMVKTVTVAEANPYLTLVDDVLYSADLRTLIFYPPYKTDAFYDIPDSVTTVGMYAISGNPYLRQLNMSCAAESLPQYAVRNCKALTHIALPPQLKSVAASAVYGSGEIQSVYIPATLVSFGSEWIAGTGGAYPVFYSDTPQAELLSYAERRGIEVKKGHAEHSYGILLSGEETDCETVCERVLACECGMTMRFEGAHCTVWVTDKPATCAQSGLMHAHCLVCGRDLQAGTAIGATGKHDFVQNTNDIRSLLKPATCLAPAQYCLICSVCGALDEESGFPYGGTAEHSYTGAYRSNGNGTHSRQCEVCRSWSETTVCSWSLRSSTKGDDCRSTGVNHYVCTLCGATKDEANDAHGRHSWSWGKCSVCGERYSLINSLADFFADLFARLRSMFYC